MYSKTTLGVLLIFVILFISCEKKTFKRYDELTMNLKSTENLTRYFIDNIDLQSTNNVTEAIKINSKIIEVEGWAIDDSSGNEVTKIYLVVDGVKCYEAEHGIERKDVSKEMNLGFKISVPKDYFESGDHTFNILILGQNRIFYKPNSDKSVLVNIK